MTAAERMLSKALVGSNLDTRRWSEIQAGLRDRAFFMAQVEDARILHTARQGIADILQGGKSQSEVRRDIRGVLEKIRYDPDKGLGENEQSRRGTIKDLLTKRRLDVMIETNVQQARGYADHLRATTDGALRAFPAYELIRLKNRRQPRDWDARWAEAARNVGYEGVARGAKIALKTSPIWTRLSRFGNPFPPFDFNSGMGLDDVPRSECIRIGLIDRDTPPQKPPEVHFNGSLHAEVPFGNDSPEYSDLRQKFGDFIQYDKTAHAVRWREDVFRENFDKGGKFTIKAGVATDRMLAMLNADPKLAQFATDIKGKQLVITQDWLNAKRPDGTDHRSHFGPEQEKPDNIPLDQRDVELIPSIWHNPDAVRKLQKDIFEAKIEALDGSFFVVQIKVGGSFPQLWTFFRTTKNPVLHHAAPAAQPKATLNAGGILPNR